MRAVKDAAMEIDGQSGFGNLRHRFQDVFGIKMVADDLESGDAMFRCNFNLPGNVGIRRVNPENRKKCRSFRSKLKNHGQQIFPALIRAFFSDISQRMRADDGSPGHSCFSGFPEEFLRRIAGCEIHMDVIIVHI